MNMPFGDELEEANTHMIPLKVSLFGKFYVHCGEQAVENLDACKVQELFCYLLLHAGQPHHREKLAGLLWQKQPAAKSKNYLRRTLWQLQNAFKKYDGSESFMQVEPDWIRIDYANCLRVDTAVFESAFEQVNGKQAAELDETAVSLLIEAVQKYKGDLLEGWYHDWCLFERERFRQMLLLMLDKLMIYFEKIGAYELAISQGMQILRHDQARERTHRKLMRLHYLSGDRTGALRQYKKCKAILNEELGVAPGNNTEDLRHQIETDQLILTLQDNSNTSANQICLQNALQRLQKFDNILLQTRQEVQQEIQRVETTLSQSTN